MRVLSESELLECWENGLNQSPAGHALILLTAAFPDLSPEYLAHLSIGRRDGYLLELRELTFGPKIDGIASCPECKKLQGLTFNVNDVKVSSEIGSHETLSLSVDGRELRFRLPNSIDVENASTGGERSDYRFLLLERCLLYTKPENKGETIENLPAHVVAKVEQKMAEADPQADVQLALSCAECDHQWLLAFDIVSFFWSEIMTWAQRTIREVHILASAYGWKESDILTMSPMKRSIYIGMVGR